MRRLSYASFVWCRAHRASAHSIECLAHFDGTDRMHREASRIVQRLEHENGGGAGIGWGWMLTLDFINLVCVSARVFR